MNTRVSERVPLDGGAPARDDVPALEPTEPEAKRSPPAPLPRRDRFAAMRDSELIAACLQGSEPAWNALIERFRGPIYRLALSMGLPSHDAADVLQEVSVLLVEHLGELRETAKVAPWIVITTRRVVWKRSRQRSKSLSELTINQESEDQPEQELTDNSPGPEGQILQMEEQALIRQGMERLPDRCRELLTLLYCEDPPGTYADAADRLQIASNSVGPIRARCLQSLRKILQQLGF